MDTEKSKSAQLLMRGELLTDMAASALACGEAEQAESLAREALYYLPKTPGVTRAKALRELGTAFINQGLSHLGLGALDRAAAMAELVSDPTVGAIALLRGGVHALFQGYAADAETRFRRAVELLTPLDCRSLLAMAHASLAVALFHQRNTEAEHHATIAFELRMEGCSFSAVAFFARLHALGAIGFDYASLGCDAHETGNDDI